MSKTLLGIIIFILSSPLIFAQVHPADIADATISDAISSENIKAVGNTVNNRILVIYEEKDPVLGWISLKAINIGPFGGLGASKRIVPRIDGTGLWDIAFHPVLKRYLLVYRIDKALFARPLKLNTSPKGKPKKIRDYSGESFFCTWTVKKRYVLFFSDDKELKGQALRKNGLKFREGKVLAGGELTGKAYPVGVATEVDGTAVVYYALFAIRENKFLTPMLLKTNHKLASIDSFNIFDEVAVKQEEIFMGNYDPGTGNHIITWEFKPVLIESPGISSAGNISPALKSTPMYIVKNENGKTIMEPAEIPNKRAPLALNYNRLTERFAMLYSFETEKIVDEKTIVLTNLALAIFKPDGTLLSQGTTVLTENRGTPATITGAFAKEGNYAILWSLNEETLKSIFSRLIF